MKSVKSSRIKKYSSKYSKKTYTQHQHLVVLLLQKYLKQDYRSIIDTMKELIRIRKILCLKDIPHFTTIQKFFKRFPSWMFEKLLGQTVKLFDVLDARVAIDASGYSSSYSSRYYVWRIKGETKRKSFIKDSIAIDTDRQIILSHIARKAPSHDNRDFIPLVKKTRKRVDIILVTADKGYDSEANHKLVRSMNATSMIPIREWKNASLRTGYWRRKMEKEFRKEEYGHRNKVETVFFVSKKKFGDYLVSRSALLQKKEIRMRNVLYNLYRRIRMDNPFWLLIFDRAVEKLFNFY